MQQKKKKNHVMSQSDHSPLVPLFLTDVETPLFGSVLSGVPVLPVFQLIISALLLPKHNHHHTLKTTVSITFILSLLMDED